jgi:hypothetical protein
MRTGDFEHLCSSFDPLRKVAENSSCRGLTQISKGIFERTGVLRFLNATAPHIACLGPVYKSPKIHDFPHRLPHACWRRPPGSHLHNVEIPGHKGKVRRTQTEAGLKVEMPSEKPCDHAVALKVALA